MYEDDMDWATPEERQRITAFLRHLHQTGRSPRTLASYEADWQKFGRWSAATNGEPFDVRRITSLDITDFRSHSLRNDDAPASINRRLVFLKRYCAFCRDRGDLKREVWKGIKAVPHVRTQPLAPKSLDRKSVRKLLREVELRADPRDRAIVYIILYTGLRVGELVKLRREDIELSPNKGRIIIQGSVGKGCKQRQIPVPLDARKAVQLYLETRSDDNEALLVGQRGPLQEDAIVRILRKYAEPLGIKVTPHTLRHTFAFTYLENNENDLVGLASILGHENLQTTRIYTQKRLEDLQESAENVRFF
jgi:integrase/recombinase XerC